MNIYALELNNDIKGLEQRKAYIESLVAKLENPGFVVLPELSLCSYMGSDAIWQYADIDSKDTSEWAMRIAEKYCTYISVGYLEKRGQDYYNSYMIAGKGKVYGIVRKSEGEAFVFKRGSFGNIIETPIGNVAVGICYDSRRKHLYDNIKNEELSLILFPHGSPSNPEKAADEERVIDDYCTLYKEAFGIPVVYVNSRGKLDFMQGKTGKMMTSAGFALNGMTKIYSDSGTPILSDINEVIGMNVDLVSQKRKCDIRFYGNDLVKGNCLFRNFVIKPDIVAGVRYYESNKTRPAL